ncbi:MAG: InlB B-repeat-containing protein, partial [Clostridia bacterium]|nr:InlB B-repeat-containing protein [Clostridia bacterium]
VTFDYKISTAGADKYINFYLQKDGSNQYGNFKLYGYDYYLANSRFVESAIAGITVTALDDKYARVTIDIANIAAGKITGSPTTFSKLYIRSGWSTGDVYIRDLDFLPKVNVTVNGGTGGGKYVPGAEVTVEADDPADGKVFLGWRDGSDMVSYDAEYTFNASEDVTLTAIYGTGYSSSASIGNYYYDAAALTKYDSLTFEYKIDNGSDKHFYVYIGDATVSSTFNNCYGGFKFTSSGISTGSCDAVTVTDSSDGYKFVTIILDGSKTITTAGTAPTGGKVKSFAIRSGWTSATGTVKNIKFNKVCDVSVVNGTGSIDNIINGAEITIVADAAPSGKVFVGWDNGSGLIPDSTATYTFTVTDDVTMTAIYGTVYTINVVDGTIGGDTSAEIVEGRSATVVADDAPNGKYFLGWSNNGGSSIIPSASDESYTFTVSGNVTMTAVYRAYDGTKYAKGSDAHIIADGGEDAYASVTFEYKISTLGSDKYFNFYLQKDLSNRYGAFKLFGYDYYLANGSFTESAIDGVVVELLSDKYARVTITVASIADNKSYGDPSAFSEIYIRSGWTNCDVHVRNIGFNNAGKPFSMHKGASVRIKAPYGIRFRADIPWDFYDEDASYGIIIIPYDYISKYSIDLDGDIIAQLDSGSVKYRKLECEPIRLATGDYYIQGSLTNIYESNLTRQFVGIGYSLIDDTYTYATNVDDCKRSIAAVSAKAIGLVETFVIYNSTQQEFLVHSSGSDNAASATDLSVNAFDSLENFKKDESVSISGTLTLSAAKGESEFGQIVLTAKTAAINGKGYAVIVSDLTHSDGSTILDKSAFDVYNGHYINVADNWVYYGNLGYESTMTTGYYVDAIVPFSAAAKNEETVFDRTYGNNQTVFIRFNVPEDQKAGTYTGTFKVYVLGVGYMDVPVSFTVYNFALPEENNLKSAFGIDKFSLMRLFGSANSKETEEYEELYELIKDYGINGMYNPQNYYYGENSADDYIQSLVDAYYDEKIAAVAIETFEKEAIYTYKKGLSNPEQSYTVNVVIEEDYQLCNPDTGEIIEGAHNFGTKHTLKLIAEYSIANDINLFEKLYFLVGDEPSEPEHCIRFVLSYNACRRGIDYVLNNAGIDWTGHEDIKASLQNLHIFVDSDAGKHVNDYTGSKVDGQCAGNKLVDDVYSKSARYT